MTLFGHSVWACIINTRSYLIGVGSEFNDDWNPHEKSSGYSEISREEGHVKMEAEIGMMLPQAKEHQRLLATTGS